VAAAAAPARVIHLDTSVVIDALSGPKRSAGALRLVLAGPEPLRISSLVLYEWLRGPRRPGEVEAQEALFPALDAHAFGSAEATIASRLYTKVARARGREADLAIAACAISGGAMLWTLNPADFKDIPGLELWRPDE
jgi:predicted nucleic acid-binding protein